MIRQPKERSMNNRPKSENAASPGIKILIPPRIFLACLIGGIAAGLLLPIPIPLPWPLRLPAGIGLALAGFAFMGWGHGRFKSIGNNIPTWLPATQLVTGGAYRFSRNPMYVGFVAILAGLGLAAGNLSMLLFALPMFLYLDRFVIPREERYLERRFGADYLAYRNKVRRWL
jgi:protein-S-isoprenylcysteine O-methyltransferase Ste14